VLFFCACAATTPPIINQDGTPVENGIARFEKVMLGGIEQTILIRTHDASNPVLLFLHGGPGFPMMPLFPHFNQELEKHFVVVSWDQRGAGKSYSKKISAESFTIEQFVEDTHQLVDWLRQQFNQEKIFLMGGSWGSGLGMYVIDKDRGNWRTCGAVSGSPTNTCWNRPGGRITGRPSGNWRRSGLPRRAGIKTV
jgi:pimeloyl-ACP methyl ester carboxylesterase